MSDIGVADENYIWELENELWRSEAKIFTALKACRIAQEALIWCQQRDSEFSDGGSILFDDADTVGNALAALNTALKEEK